MFTARVQAREIAIRRDLTLCSDATRVSTPHGNVHPSKLRPLTMHLNLRISIRSFYAHGYAGGAILVVLFQATYMHGFNIFSYT